VPKLYHYCVYPEKSVNFARKMFETCMEGYIMLVQKEVGPSLRGQEEKEV
jgi:hypothetical protein